MKRGIAVAGAVLALMVPAVAHASDGAASESATRALTKNQRIALIALDAHQAAVGRYANYLSSHPAKVASIGSRIKCVVDRIIAGGIYYTNFNSLPDYTKMEVAFTLQYSYWYGHMFRIMPEAKGKFSARAFKSIFLSAADRARKLKPDIKGERIIRGLRAQADLITTYRGFKDVRMCAVLDDWGTNGFDLDRLDPLTSQYAVIMLKLQASNAEARIDSAITALQTVPGVAPSEASGFNDLVPEDSFQMIAQTFIP